jgi:hypothetical protein
MRAGAVAREGLRALGAKIYPRKKIGQCGAQYRDPEKTQLQSFLEVVITVYDVL